MLRHFNTLNTPLKSINRYPGLKDQEVRFTNAGWASVTARSLWDLWSDPRFITARERTSLNAIEVFDEWEEYALFATHYLLLVASNTLRGNAFHNFVEATSLGSADSFRIASADDSPLGASELVRVSVDSRELALVSEAVDQERKIARRFGVLYQSGMDNFCYHGGYGERTRLKTADLYVSKRGMPVSDLPPPLTMDARMCHTVTSFPETPETDHVDHLIVGGRSSPDHAHPDCWYQRNHVWERVEDLPKPLFRHCATSVTDAQGRKAVLVYGGKSNNCSVMNEWLLWRNDSGWTKLTCTENRLTPRFGAAMSSDGADRGILLGGMAEDGTILPEYWRWSLDFTAETPSVNIIAYFHESSMLQQKVCRFGASLTQAPSCLYLVGGISHQGILPDDYNVIKILSNDPFHIQLVPEPRNFKVPAALLVGHSSIWDGDGLIIVGGGAVCFSFGNHSNSGVWKLLRGERYIYNPWTLKEGDDQPDTGEPPQKRLKLTLNGKNDSIAELMRAPEPVSRERIHKAERFVRLVHKSRPAVLEGLKLGRCTTSWTTEYLKRKIGPDLEVGYADVPYTHMMLKLLLR
jgi:tRNA wybutosine-synthesizing protein 4